MELLTLEGELFLYTNDQLKQRQPWTRDIVMDYRCLDYNDGYQHIRNVTDETVHYKTALPPL